MTFDASGTARYEYNTNVYDLQGGYPVPGTSDFQHADSLYTYGAALDVDYLVDRQKFFATLWTTEYRYDHFSQLDHDEYNVDAGWNWRLGNSLDGTLEVLRNHEMVAFTYVENSQFVLQTEQRESAKIGFLALPDWRIEGSGYHRIIDQTSADSINDLTESFGQAALKYVGVAGLSAGFSVGYTKGDYTATLELPNSYRQLNYALVASYIPTGRSTINASIGYSDRTSPSALNTASGATGELDYQNQLTAKTAVQVKLSRLLNSYVAQVGTEVDNIAAFNVVWQATYKLAVMGGYTWTQRELPGQGNDPLGSERTDRLQYASIKFDYEPLRWLSLMPYVNLLTRNSNFVGGNFNSTLYGLYFTVQWQNGPQPNRTFKFQNRE